MFVLPKTLHQLLSTNWIKVNRFLSLAISLNKRKYLHNTAVGEFINTMSIVSYEALNHFIAHYSKRGRHTFMK